MKCLDLKTEQNTTGFSLAELLLVLVIVALIMAWSVPSLIPAIQSKTLNSVCDKFEQNISQIRQISMTEDVVVDIDFLSFPPEPGLPEQLLPINFGNGFLQAKDKRSAIFTG